MDIESNIPKILFQTSLEGQPEHVVDMIKSKCPRWKYLHFSDGEIVKYFQDNPLKEFPLITDKFNHFSNGAHKADLFRYYYLYINGGVFLDSDAMIEENINSILKGYDFVSVNGYHDDRELIFNGFIGTTKNNIIIYEALKDIYNVNDKDLIDDYHLICKNLLKIVQGQTSENIKIFQEKKKRSFKPGVLTYDGEKIVLTHYCYLKRIPDCSGKLARKVYPFVYRYRLFYKIYKRVYKIQQLFSK